ncbi:MAG: NUDIX domain-containing protein [Vitreoscilla sp.]|nr:NUDIX domain-containing protein [Vitreoscilla sp.]
MPHRISAGVIVEHEGRVLLVNHVRPGRYDFWVCPGGGVKGDESLEEAAAREAFEETGLNVRIVQLLYIEELISPECRYVKFWFSGEYTGGTFDVSHPEAQACQSSSAHHGALVRQRHAARWRAYLGASTQARSACFMRPACASASSPQPQK